MASKYDLVQLIGNKACMVASNLTEIVAAQPACTVGQTWNMGAMVLATVIVGLIALTVQERRRRFRTTFFR